VQSVAKRSSIVPATKGAQHRGAPVMPLKIAAASPVPSSRQIPTFGRASRSCVLAYPLWAVVAAAGSRLKIAGYISLFIIF
jgi:hypothetical protein